MWNIYSESGKRQLGGSNFDTAINEVNGRLGEGTTKLWYILHKFYPVAVLVLFLSNVLEIGIQFSRWPPAHADRVSLEKPV